MLSVLTPHSRARQVSILLLSALVYLVIDRLWVHSSIGFALLIAAVVGGSVWYGLPRVDEMIERLRESERS